ncbi:MAG: starch synthase [Bergeyella sp.]|nr:starch synthase [Bergeyella sp.]
MKRNQKILYVTTEMFPYQESSSIASTVNKMALKMHREGRDVRVFMPRFGPISERKFQLHEVIRLSGMNIIINDLDQPLIIKVASLPGERLQMYFIDNEEYFKRKFYYTDENDRFYEDNDERAVFFAKGVIETVKKLNWVPDIIHFNGWMSSFVPIYLKNYYRKDFYFSKTTLVMSLYNEEDAEFNPKVKETLRFDNITDIKSIKEPKVQNFVIESMEFVDKIVKGDEFLEEKLERAYNSLEKEKLDFLEPENIGGIY